MRTLTQMTLTTGPLPKKAEKAKPEDGYKTRTKASQHNHIRNWRLYRGIDTQGELAALTFKVPGCEGLDRATICRLESGMPYKQYQLIVLAKALNCHPADLIGTNPLNTGDVIMIYRSLAKKQRDQVKSLITKLSKKGAPKRPKV